MINFFLFAYFWLMCKAPLKSHGTPIFYIDIQFARLAILFMWILWGMDSTFYDWVG